MQSLFALANNETVSGSLFYLNAIFGTVGNVLGGTGPGLLGAMFKVFNTTVLTLGALLVTYTTTVSILLTAHEGEALGKKFHSLWIPLRTVMGIASLVPTTTGYSTLQIALMWFIIQGVGAADTLWTKTVDYVAAGGTTTPSSPGGSGNVILQQNLQVVFENLLCQAVAKAKYSSGYYCFDNPGDTFCGKPDSNMLDPVGGSQVANGVYSMGPHGDCGQLNLNYSGDASTPGLVAAKQAAFAQIIPTLGSIATQMISADYAYATWYNAPAATPGTPPSWVTQYCSDNGQAGSQCNATAFTSLPPPAAQATTDSKNTVKSLYWPYALEPTAGGNFIALTASVFSGLVNTAMTNNANSNNPALNSWQQIAEDNGWIFAGAYYYNIAQSNNSTTNYANITNNVGSPPSGHFSSSTMNAWISHAQTLIDAIGTATAPANSSGFPASCGGLPIGDSVCGSLIQGWVSSLAGSSNAGLTQNPVVAAQGFGNDVLNAIQWAVLAIFLFTAALGFTGMIVTFGEGFFTSAAITMTMTILPFAILIITIFFGVGVTLAVYTPMIPYMLFTFGALNWLIATIETMLAAPIVAIGLLHPEGGENLWGKAEKSLELLLNIFLRPSLMIFGMVAGMLLSYAVIMMINYAFLNVVGMVGGGLNVIEAIFFMVLYTSIFTTAINKCFDLIHQIPDKILRWIGTGGETFGESGGVEKIGEAMKGAEAKGAETAGKADKAGEETAKTLKTGMGLKGKGGEGPGGAGGVSGG